MLPTSQLEYDLPQEAIATHPATPRESAKLMIVSRSTGAIIEHTTVADLPKYLRQGDCMILNNTKVLPARVQGERIDTHGKVGGLYLRSASHDDYVTTGTKPVDRAWVLMLQGKSMHTGVQLRFGDVILQLLNKYSPEPGAWIARVTNVPAHDSDAAVLERIGLTPLPPYILRARKHRQESNIPQDQSQSPQHSQDITDKDRYQTVYASGAANSVAAPTAGLHLTSDILHQLSTKGVLRSDVTLHVGTGTFKTVETMYVEEHPMHTEWCSMPKASYDAVLTTKRTGGRVICVGTTSARTIESFAATDHEAIFSVSATTGIPASLNTKLLITPGYQLRWMDGLLTNFHLPKSTLLALVGALLPGGLPQLKSIYAAALERNYRFFSYGDAMLIID